MYKGLSLTLLFGLKKKITENGYGCKQKKKSIENHKKSWDDYLILLPVHLTDRFHKLLAKNEWIIRRKALLFNWSDQPHKSST